MFMQVIPCPFARACMKPPNLPLQCMRGCVDGGGERGDDDDADAQAPYLIEGMEPAFSGCIEPVCDSASLLSYQENTKIKLDLTLHLPRQLRLLSIHPAHDTLPLSKLPPPRKGWRAGGGQGLRLPYGRAGSMCPVCGRPGGPALCEHITQDKLNEQPTTWRLQTYSSEMGGIRV